MTTLNQPSPWEANYPRPMDSVLRLSDFCRGESSDKEFPSGTKIGSLTIEHDTDPRGDGTRSFPEGRVYRVQCCRQAGCPGQAWVRLDALNWLSKHPVDGCLLSQTGAYVDLAQFRFQLGQVVKSTEHDGYPEDLYAEARNEGKLAKGSPINPAKAYGTAWAGWEANSPLGTVTKERVLEILKAGAELFDDNMRWLFLELDSSLHLAAKRCGMKYPEFLKLSPKEMWEKVTDKEPPTAMTGKRGNHVGIDTSPLAELSLRQELSDLNKVWALYSEEEFVQCGLVNGWTHRYFELLHFKRESDAAKWKNGVPELVRQHIENVEPEIKRRVSLGYTIPQAYACWWMDPNGKGMKKLFDFNAPGNWKTADALLIAKERQARLIVVFGPNAMVKTYEDRRRCVGKHDPPCKNHWQCEGSKLDSIFGVKVERDFHTVGTGDEGRRRLRKRLGENPPTAASPLFLLVNPEKYQNEGELLEVIKDEPIDMFIWDECQDFAGEDGFRPAEDGSPRPKTLRVENMRRTVSLFENSLHILLSGTGGVRGHVASESSRIIKNFCGEEIAGKNLAALHIRLLKYGYHFPLDERPRPDLDDYVLRGNKEKLVVYPLSEELFRGVGLVKGGDSVTYLKAECILTPSKLRHLIREGIVTRENVCRTIFYTTHVGNNLVKELQSILFSEFSIEPAVYTGESKDKPSVEELAGRPIIASRPLMTGVNGLHMSHSNMVLLSCPWNYNDYLQSICRLWRWNGDGNPPPVSVHIVVGLVEYDVKRLNRLLNRKSDSDAWLLGKRPPSLFDSNEEKAQVQKLFDELSDRLGTVRGAKTAEYVPTTTPGHKRLGHNPTDMAHMNSGFTMASSGSEFRNLNLPSEDLKFYQVKNAEQNAKVAKHEYDGLSHQDYLASKIIEIVGLATNTLNVACGDTTLPDGLQMRGADPYLPEEIYESRSDILKVNAMDDHFSDKIAKGFGLGELPVVMNVGGLFGSKRNGYAGLYRQLDNMVAVLEPNGILALAYPPNHSGMCKVGPYLESIGLVKIDVKFRSSDYCYVIFRKPKHFS